MTDELIIKNFRNGVYKNKPMLFGQKFLGSVLDLLNRQSAEIERLNAKIKAKDKINYYNMGQLKIAREELNKYPIKTITGNNCEIHSKTSKDYDNLMADIKSEAIKEFAKKLKEDMRLEDDCNYDCRQCNYECREWVPIIDCLVKEMTEVEE